PWPVLHVWPGGVAVALGVAVVVLVLVLVALCVAVAVASTSCGALELSPASAARWLAYGKEPSVCSALAEPEANSATSPKASPAVASRNAHPRMPGRRDPIEGVSARPQ